MSNSPERAVALARIDEFCSTPACELTEYSRISSKEPQNEYKRYYTSLSAPASSPTHFKPWSQSPALRARRLKNEMMLPAVLDPWAAHALYEAANLASHASGSKVWLVSAAPKAKLQQVMMNVAQKANFELVPIDVPANGFADAHAVAALLADAVQGDSRSRPFPLLLFGGWESASRGAGVTMQLVGEQLGIQRSVSRRRPGHMCSPTARLKFWSESKVGGT